MRAKHFYQAYMISPSEASNSLKNYTGRGGCKPFNFYPMLESQLK